MYMNKYNDYNQLFSSSISNFVVVGIESETSDNDLAKAGNLHKSSIIIGFCRSALKKSDISSL